MRGSGVLLSIIPTTFEIWLLVSLLTLKEYPLC
ncbi:hypothetical protein XM38_024010 [Halomicronema hongdechloris C2206]|uniref:Uncharacterized protein n=1 Tax=Halomicronema hongdechloris C2206 TaxID=1641165 RepID=A0A1Z3HMB0_9CYAN|nr:hypothetical protein XM38_024010 [Halomicronema hongdechloris C2206]